MSEFSYAARRLRNNPIFSAGVLVVLAILIGATASVFALVDGVVFKRFDVEQPSRLLFVWESSSARHMPQFAVAAANYLDWQRQTTTFTDLAALSHQQYTLRTRQGAPERVTGAAVTPNYFRTLGVRPLVGRLPSANGDANEILISAGYWARSFGENPTIIGQVVDLDDRPSTIVGVVPPGALGIYDVYSTLQFAPAARADRDRHYLVVIGRLRSGITPAAAQQNLATVAARLSASFPATNRDWTVKVAPLVDQLVGKVRPALVLLMVAGMCVLLVGAANVTNLFLVRGEARSHDLAVKSALGAPRTRIARELTTESVILAMLGGAVGFALSTAGVRTLKLLAPANLPRLDSVAVDARTALFCVSAAAAMILVFGLIPAHRLSAVALSSLVRESGRTGRSKKGVRLQDVLVVTQVFLSMVLLTTAFLFLEAFDHFRRLDEGFRADGVLTAEVSVPPSRNGTPEQEAAFAATVRQQLVAQPGVIDASVGATLPGMSTGNGAFYIVGKTVADPSRAPIAMTNAVDGGYFSTLRIPVLRGRSLLSSDTWRAPKVVVIDQLLATHFFPGEDPVGREVTFPGSADTLEIVGVVGSVKQRGLIAEDGPVMYFPFNQWPTNELVIAFRGVRAPELYAAEVRRVVHALDSGAAVSGLVALESRMLQTVAMTRFAAFLASVFAIVAALLGTIGVYAILAFGVSERRREFAIRLALGADRRVIVGDVFGKALGLTGAGVIAALLASRLLADALSALLVGADTHDARVFAAAGLLMMLVALVAAIGPAIRSIRMSLISELRSA